MRYASKLLPRARRMAAIVAGGLLAGGAAGLPAKAQDTLVIRGETVSADIESVKCDAPKVADVSTKRLADCGSAQLITLPKTGSRFIRFEIGPGDPSISQGHRAELRDMFEARNGQEVWYRFKTLLPLDFPFDDASRIVTAQWHERMPDGDSHKRPPIAHRVVGHGFQVTLWNDGMFDASNGTGNGIVAVDDRAIKPGRVIDYVTRVVWRPDAGGVVTGWRREGSCSVETMRCTYGDWARFLDRKGPIGFTTAAGYYFKFGVYTTHRFAKPLVVYHGDYRRGSNAAAVGVTGPVFLTPSVARRAQPDKTGPRNPGISHAPS